MKYAIKEALLQIDSMDEKPPHFLPLIKDWAIEHRWSEYSILNPLSIQVKIASFSGREEMLVKTINSLTNQVDYITVWWNGPGPCPIKSTHSGSVIIRDQNFDVADMGKFATQSDGDVDRIELFCDDDIIYPPDYVAKTVCALSLYPTAVISYHGRLLTGDGRPYYAQPGINCLAEVPESGRVHVPGSGCAAFINKKEFKLYWFFNKETLLRFKYMADLALGHVAALNKLPCYAIAHKAGWLEYQNPTNTIYDRFHNKDIGQNKEADIILEMINNQQF